MAMANNVYNEVISDVGNQLRGVFSNQTSGDDFAHLLLQAQQTWREKMVHHGVLQVPGETNTSCGGVQPLVHDLNVPFEGTQEFESLTATTRLPQTSLQMRIPTSSAAEAGKSKCLLAGQGKEGKGADKPAGNMKTRRLPPFMRHPSGSCRPWLNQSPGGVDANDAYEPSRKKECGIKPQAPIEDFTMPSSRKRKWEDYMLDFSTDGHVAQAGSRVTFSECFMHHKGSVINDWRASKTPRTKPT